jgi:hypothetical protein
MPDEIKVDPDKFDRILGRMLAAKPLSKAEISARIKAEREATIAAARERVKRITSKKLGQWP